MALRHLRGIFHPNESGSSLDEVAVEAALEEAIETEIGVGLVPRRWQTNAGRRGYASGMTRTTASEALLLLGLSEDDVARVVAVIEASHAPATLHVYSCAWGLWERWATARDLAVLPADPEAVAAYLVDRAAQGRCFGTIEVTCSAISHTHRAHDLPDPVHDEIVRAVRRGLRRMLGVAPTRQARPLAAADIVQILGAIDRTTPLGIRDAALILIGFASALRAAELVALNLADLDFQPGGVLLAIRRSKTDPDGHGRVVAVARGPARLAPHPRRRTRPAVHCAAQQPGHRRWPRAPAARLGTRHPHPAYSCRSRRPRRHPDHQPLPTRRTRHHRRPGRRRPGTHRRPDPPPRHLGAHRVLHPTPPGTRRHLQQGPRPLTDLGPRVRATLNQFALRRAVVVRR